MGLTTPTTPTAPTAKLTATGRPVAAGGWRRAVVGLVVGAIVGVAVLVARRTTGSG